MAPEAKGQAAADVRSMDQRALMIKYAHEAAEHRRILFGRGVGLCPAWRNFRQFLIDVGPAPDLEHVIIRTVAGVTYAPGKCAWVHRERQAEIARSIAEAPPPPKPEFGIWANLGGQQIEYGALARRLGVPLEAMTVALRNGCSPEDLVRQAGLAEEMTRAEAPWLPADPKRRQAFFMAFRMWHMQVHPKFASGATPSFLYLYSALPAMKKCRDGLMALDLWNPPTEAGRQTRNAHILWRRFCEAMPRVEAARSELAIYRQYSLSNELDELCVRVDQAERRFRTNPAARPVRAA
jgi:hypothetical protein